MQTKHQKEKALAIVLAIIETALLFSSFIYITMNIQEPEPAKSPLEKWTAADKNSDFLVWMSCLTATFTFVSILLVIGTIKSNFWWMIPSIGLHIGGIIFIVSVMLAGIIRLSQDPVAAWSISEAGIILIVLTSILSGGIGIFFAKLIMDQAEGVKKIVLTEF